MASASQIGTLVSYIRDIEDAAERARNQAGILGLDLTKKEIEGIRDEAGQLRRIVASGDVEAIAGMAT